MILGMIGALAVGIYIGLGWPGLPFGKQDRVLPPGMRRQRKQPFTPVNWIRPPQRQPRR